MQQAIVHLVAVKSVFSHDEAKLVNAQENDP